MGTGTCDLPLMTGYIHTIYPRQSVSFKMGSPLRMVGLINADTSTGIAGWLERKPDLVPVRMTLYRDPTGTPQTFNVQVVREHSLLSSLVLTVLTNSVDMEGDLPEEMTATMQARIDVEGHAPVVLEDTFSGAAYSASHAPQSLYGPVASIVGLLTNNPYKPVQVNHIECETRVLPGRRTADIEAVELESETYAPGDTLKGTVYVRPYKGSVQRLPVSLQLPADFPEGTYSATVCDDLTNTRLELRDNPQLNYPQNLDQLFEAVKLTAAARRTNLVVRVPAPAVGVALDGKALPNLPPSMVQILGNPRKSGAQTLAAALVSRQSTDWVVQGSESARFTVTRTKRQLTQP
jgi:hypothetical protein